MEIFKSKRPLIMGIVNLTPDSFYDGGSYLDPDKAKKHILGLIEAGADIIDLGAASSRPGKQGHHQVSGEEELARLCPLLEKLDPKVSVPFSIDTDKPEVAEAALAAGASIINSTGASQTVEMMELAAHYRAYLAIMFRGPFQSSEIIAELCDFFDKIIKQAIAHGLSEDKLILDPGFGFNMDEAACVTILRNLDKLTVFGLPVLVGMSNKRFIGAISGAPLQERGAANIAAEIVALEKGASILRVHNVRSSVYALRTYLALKGSNNNG